MKLYKFMSSSIYNDLLQYFIQYHFTGVFPVSEDSNEMCSTRFMVCSKGMYGFRGNYFRCPLGYVFHW